MAKAYLLSRLSCGECKTQMPLDEKKMTVRCPNMHCDEYKKRKEYLAPSVVLKPYVEKQPASK